MAHTPDAPGPAGRPVAVALAIAMFLLFPALLIHRARALAIFEDFDAELPSLTVLAMRVPGWLVVAACLVGLATLIALQAFPRDKRLAGAFAVISLILGFAAAFVYVFSIWMPLVKLQQSVM